MPSYSPVDPPETNDLRMLAQWMIEQLRQISGGFEEIYDAQWTLLEIDPDSKGVVASGTGNYGTPAARQIGDFVMLRGYFDVSASIPRDSMALAKLPDRYIPRYSLRVPGLHWNNESAVAIHIEGIPDNYGPANPGWIYADANFNMTEVSISGIIYPLS